MAMRKGILVLCGTLALATASLGQTFWYHVGASVKDAPVREVLGSEDQEEIVKEVKRLLADMRADDEPPFRDSLTYHCALGRSPDHWQALHQLALRAPQVVRSMVRDSATKGRTVLLIALAKLTDPADMGLVREFLQSSNLTYRWRAVYAAGLIGTPEGLEIALKASKDPSVIIRDSSAMALSCFPDKEALEALKSLAKDPVHEVKAMAAFVLKRMS